MKEKHNEIDMQLTHARIKESNKNFWQNLNALNLLNMQVGKENIQPLLDLEQQMAAVESLWLKALKEKNRKIIAEQEGELIAIKERAIQLVTPNFISSGVIVPHYVGRFNAIKREFLIYLHEPFFKQEDLTALSKEMWELSCDQAFSEIDEFFDVKPRMALTSLNHFIKTVEQHKLIPTKKPWAICFDKRRAFELFHEKQTHIVMGAINTSEKAFSDLMRANIKFDSLERFNPMKTGKTPTACHIEFNRYFFEELNFFENQLRMLEKEYWRVEDQKPFVLVRPFYITTETAINVWQYELLTQKLKTFKHVAQFLKNRTNDLNNWLAELSKRGSMSQSLIKSFRNSLLQSVFVKNEVLKTLCEKTQKQLAKMAQYKLNQDHVLVSSIEQTIEETKKQLTDLQSFSLGIVEGMQFFTATEENAKKNQESWKSQFQKGKQIPEAVLTQWVLNMEEESKSQPLLDDAYLGDVVKGTILKIQAGLNSVNKESDYIQQALKILLASKNDFLLTQLKRCIHALSPPLRQNSVMRFCLKQIGTTVSERVEKLEKLICKSRAQRISRLESMNQWIGVSKTLSRYLKELIHYVQNHFVHSIEQLRSEQTQLLSLIEAFVPPKGSAFNVAEILDDLVYLSERAYLLKEYQKSADQLLQLQQDNQYVSDEILPFPQESVLFKVCSTVSLPASLDSSPVSSPSLTI